MTSFLSALPHFGPAVIWSTHGSKAQWDKAHQKAGDGDASHCVDVRVCVWLCLWRKAEGCCVVWCGAVEEENLEFGCVSRDIYTSKTPTTLRPFAIAFHPRCVIFSRNASSEVASPAPSNKRGSRGVLSKWKNYVKRMTAYSQ